MAGEKNTDGRGRKKKAPRTAFEMVVLTEMRRRGLAYRTLARRVCDQGTRLTGQALYRRVTREVPTMDTVSLVAKAIGVDTKVLLARVRDEVSSALEDGRVLRGGGKIQGPMEV